MKEQLSNNLEEYFEQQIQEYSDMCDSLNNFYEKNTAAIQECHETIAKLQEKEDAGFQLFSPITIDSESKEQIIQTRARQEMYEKQNEKYMHDIQFYEEKLKEMKEQLEFYREQQIKKETNSQDEQTETEKPDIVADKPAEEIQTLNTKNVNTNKRYVDKLRDVYAKLEEMNNYLYVDMVRCSLELDKVRREIMQLIHELEDANVSRETFA
ncbi:MAG: hypothetical protein ACLRVS_00625 [Lachnospiraceae bacterium]|mgnify:FL=1